MGAMALFGEKNTDSDVRVVNIGGWSIELWRRHTCSKHRKHRNLQIVSESGIGAGVRRIEAVTSKEAYELLEEEEKTTKTSSNNC